MGLRTAIRQSATRRTDMNPAPSDRPAVLPLLQVVSPAAEAEQLDGALAADPPLEPSESFLAELAADSERLEAATPQAILKYAVDRFAPRFTMATAFGPEGMTLIHMLAEFAPRTPIFNLDTGYQFPETLELRERVKRRYGIEIEMKQPDTTVDDGGRIRSAARRAGLQNGPQPVLFRPQTASAADGCPRDVRLGQRDPPGSER